MLNEKFFRALFFVVIVSAGVYYFYPTELNEAQRLAYLKSYGVTLGLTIGGTAIGVTLGFILAFLKFLNIKIKSPETMRKILVSSLKRFCKKSGIVMLSLATSV